MVCKIHPALRVFVDLLGQGLVFPIINALIMESDSSFLPNGTSDATRHLYYGLVIGAFFLCWFLAALGATILATLGVVGTASAVHLNAQQKGRSTWDCRRSASG